MWWRVGLATLAVAIGLVEVAFASGIVKVQITLDHGPIPPPPPSLIGIPASVFVINFVVLLLTLPLISKLAGRRGRGR